MSDHKLPTRPPTCNTPTHLRATNAQHSALRTARAEALLQQIVCMAKSATPGGSPTVALAALCEQARTRDTFILSHDWTMRAVEHGVGDLVDVAAVRLVACEGEVRVQLLVAAPVSLRSIPGRPQTRPGARP
jgi:hypothetical protein